MSEAAVNIELKPRKLVDPASFSNLICRTAIKSLCPFFQSEAIFGAPLFPETPVNFSFWIQQSFEGDLSGQLAVACEGHTLKAVAKHFGLKREGKADIKSAFLKLFGEIQKSFREQLEFDDFTANWSGEAQAFKNFNLAVCHEPSILCSVETKYGEIKLHLRLDEKSGALLHEQYGTKIEDTTRKIRVGARQLDSLYNQIKKIEDLESQILLGPHIRQEIRSEIRKIKRVVHHMKSEPMDLLFSPARKLVVDVAKQQGKQVRLSTEGTKLYLDKALLNYLYAPILHLIRNAVDHGIEDPLTRERAGKNGTGEIKCLATFTQHGIRIIVSDDGRGLDVPRIRAQAVAKGLIPQEEADKKLAVELYPMLFNAGFSTREKADNVSGRGMGLNIVKRELDILGGQIKILSSSKHGTSFEIFVPLNADLTASKQVPLGTPQEMEAEDEKANLLDELSSYFERLFRTVESFKKEKIRASAYEAYRLVHSIRGLCAFLTWNRVSLFCHQVEDLLKAISEEKLPVNANTIQLVSDVTQKLHKFCELCRNDEAIPLPEIRRLEGNILRALWTTAHEEDQTNFSFGRHHLEVVESLTGSLFSKASLTSKREFDFSKARTMPFGTVIHFSGDRTGYAGIFLPEETFSNVIHPLVHGKSRHKPNQSKAPLRTKLMGLSDFANLMGRQFVEMAHPKKINLECGTPFAYQLNSKILKLFDNPTYCYRCELKGFPFLLAGDFRAPGEAQSNLDKRELPFVPSLLLRHFAEQTARLFAKLDLEVNYEETTANDNHLGIPDGWTIMTMLHSTPETEVFVSFESRLANAIFEILKKEKLFKSADNNLLTDSLVNFHSKILLAVESNLQKEGIHTELSTPSLFLGQVRAASINKAHQHNIFKGSTERGRFEIQVLVPDTHD